MDNAIEEKSDMNKQLESLRVDVDAKDDDNRRLEMDLRDAGHKQFFTVAVVRDRGNDLLGIAQQRNKRNSKTPLQQLGPFLLTKAKSETTVSRGIESLGSYEVDLATSEAPALRSLLEMGVNEKGKLSPFCKVTLSASKRTEADIPPDATEFAWSYPLDGALNAFQTIFDPSIDSDEYAQFNEHLPDLLYFAFGAFIYVDGSDNVLSANAVVGSAEGEGEEGCSGVSFKGPYAWDDTLTQALWNEGRFQRVTVEGLINIGVKYFCWVRPSETIEQEGGEAEEEVQDKHVSGDGAFVYLFNDTKAGLAPDRSECDCFFVIDSGQSHADQLEERMKESQVDAKGKEKVVK